MLKVSQAQLSKFRKIVKAFEAPTIPAPNSWRRKSGDDIWIRVVSQVAVVGNASPAQKLKQPQIREQIQWKLISQMDDAEAARAIWNVLRQVGARYTASRREDCRKTAALVRNLEVLKKFPGGPKGFLRTVANLEGTSNRKIAFLADRLSYIKNKGARDFLISGFGIIHDHIAIDSRIKAVLQHLGIHLPSNVTSKASVYAEVERELDKRVCRPIGITLAQLDQILFLHHEKIIREF